MVLHAAYEQSSAPTESRWAALRTASREGIPCGYPTSRRQLRHQLSRRGLWLPGAGSLLSLHLLTSQSTRSNMPSAIPGPTASTPLLQAHAASSSAARRAASPSSSRSPSPSPSRRPDLLPPPSPVLGPRRRRRRTPTPRAPLVPALIILGTVAVIAFVAWDVSSLGGCYFPSVCRALGKGKGRKEDVWQRNVGPYAPYRAQGEGGGKRNLPRGCEINQVNVVS